MDELKAAEPPAIPPKSSRRRVSKAANEEAYQRYQAQRIDFDLPFHVKPLNPARRRSEINSSPDHSPDLSKKREDSISSDGTADGAADDLGTPTRGRVSLVQRFTPSLRRTASSDTMRFGFRPRPRNKRGLSASGRPAISSPRGVRSANSTLTASGITADDLDDNTGFTEKELEFLRSKGIDPSLSAKSKAGKNGKHGWRTTISALPGMPTF